MVPDRIAISLVGVHVGCFPAIAEILRLLEVCACFAGAQYRVYSASRASRMFAWDWQIWIPAAM